MRTKRLSIFNRLTTRGLFMPLVRGTAQEMLIPTSPICGEMAIVIVPLEPFWCIQARFLLVDLRAQPV